MARRPSPTLVGAFILGGVLLVVAAIAIWGSGRLFDRRYRYVCYFPGSVNGLNPGAPVKYRGVAVGSVINMRIHFEQQPNDTRIPVFVELSDKRVRDLGYTREPSPKMIKELIDRGLRARLESQSLVTGQLYVNLDLFPDTPVEPAHPASGFPEIPTIPTTLEEATRTLTSLLGKLKEADVAGTARSLANAVEGLDRLVNTPSIQSTLSQLPSTVASVRQLAKSLDVQFGAVREDLSGTLGEVRALTAARGPVVIEFQRALVDVQKAASAIRVLADFLQRNPNALIVGKKRP